MLRPIVVTIQASTSQPSPFDVYSALREHGAWALLENGRGWGYSYVMIAGNDEWVCRDGRVVGDELADPWRSLNARLDRCVEPHPELRNFCGGLVGFLGYDMARTIERLPPRTPATRSGNSCPENPLPLSLPDALFLRVDAFIEFDHDAGVVRVVRLVSGEDNEMDELNELAQRVMDAPVGGLGPPPPILVPSRATPATSASLSPEEYQRIVERGRKYIYDGDIFQVNLSVRFAMDYSGDPLRIYRELRLLNPSPFMAYIPTAAGAIASASPELLMSVANGQISTRPIAGTRPRGASAKEDEANIAELVGNEKERAEHLMLVDLERNDIGRVARYGSVEVNEFMVTESYSHVIHIVSNVRGTLAEEYGAIDAIRAMFPGGTITGAPKVRSMEIIEELEPVARGIYTGSIGWIGYNGDAELNIVIRTVVVDSGIAYVQAGAGIVADSNPPDEYAESYRKAMAGLDAVAKACDGVGT